MSSEDRLRRWLIGIGVSFALSMLLARVVFAVPYEFNLHYPYDDGASSVLCRALQLGETQTDSTLTSSFPDDTSITLDTRYTYNLRFIWVYPGGDTQYTEMAIPSTDTNSVDSINWALEYLTSGGYDSVFTRWRANGASSSGSFWVTSFPFDTTATLNPNYYYKFEYDWYLGTTPITTNSIVPPMLASSDYIWPSSPGMVNLFLQYSRNGEIYEGAVLTVSNPKVATDTSTGQVIGPFRAWDVTDSVGVAMVRVVPSPYYHDPKKALYHVTLSVGGLTVKDWKQMYIPNQDTVRLIVED